MIKLSTSRALRQTKEMTYRVNVSSTTTLSRYYKNYYFNKKESAIERANELKEYAERTNQQWEIILSNQETYEYEVIYTR